MQDDSPAVSYRWSITELQSNSGKAGTIIMVFTCTGASKLFSKLVCEGGLIVFANQTLFFLFTYGGNQEATKKKKPFSGWISIDSEFSKMT